MIRPISKTFVKYRPNIKNMIFEMGGGACTSGDGNFQIIF